MVQDELCGINLPLRHHNRNPMLALPKVDETIKVMLNKVIFSYEFNLDIESLMLSLLGLMVQSSLVSGYLDKSSAGCWCNEHPTFDPCASLLASF